MACLGPQTASQIMPVEVPSAAGRGTSEGHFREGLPSAAGREGHFEGNDALLGAERVRGNH